MKLKWNSLQSTVASALAETGVDLFPNIVYMLSLLAVLPVTSCEAERTISELGRLKTSLEVWTGTFDRIGTNDIHYDIPEDIVQKYSVDNPIRLKLSNPFNE